MKRAILIFTLFSGLAGGLHAGQVMTYQGRLKESGAPANGSRGFSFSFCDNPLTGTCYPSPDGAMPFQVTNGLFTSTFTVPTVDLSAGPWYLSISVNASPLMPREQLTFVPYSVYAASAAYSAASVQRNGDTMTGQLTLAGSSLTVSGALGTWSAANTFAPNVVISSASTAQYGGIYISTNIYLPPGAAYHGDGSGLTGVTASGAVSRTGDTMSGQLTLAGSSLTVGGDSFSVGGSTFVVGAGAVGIGTLTPRNLFEVKDLIHISTWNYSNAFGFQAGYYNAGLYNYFYGWRAGYNNTTGGNNMFLGYSAGFANTTAAGNTVVGVAAVENNITGGNNTVLGYSAGYGVSGNSFSDNTLIGYDSGMGLTTGNKNVMLGSGAGTTLVNGSGNIMIGYGQNASAPAANKELNVGGVLFGDLTAGTIGISTRAPQAALDVVSTGTLVSQYAQIWRDSTGLVVASMTATGRYYGDGSGLTGITATDNTKLPISGGMMTGDLNMGTHQILNTGNVAIGAASAAVPLQVNTPATANTIVEALRIVNSGAGNTAGATLTFFNNLTPFEQASVGGFYDNPTNTATLAFYTGSSHTERMRIIGNGYVGISTTAPVTLFTVENGSITVRGTSAGIVIGDPARVITPEPTGANGGGLRVSTNVYVLGFSSAAKYFGDGSGLTNVADPGALQKTGGSMTGPLSISWDIPGTAFNIGGSTLAVYGGKVGIGMNAPAYQLDVNALNPADAYAARLGINGVVISTGGAIQTTGIGYGTTAGNARGRGAVDLQTWRGAVAQVASGFFSTIGGGNYNQASGLYSTIPGGSYNTASGNYSFAAGYAATASAQNTFTWSDSGGNFIDNNVQDRTIFKDKGGFMVLGTTNPVIDAFNRGVMITGYGAIGISTGTPYAALDVVSSGTAASVYAQIWRDSTGLVVASMSATGVMTGLKFAGDGSGLSNISGDSLGSHIATTTLNMAGFGIVKVSTITPSGDSVLIRPYSPNENTDYAYAISIGSGTYGNYTNGVGVGANASNNYTDGVGVGNNAQNNNSSGVGLGDNASGNSNRAVGIGAYSRNNGAYGSALGAYSYAASSAAALGSYAKANAVGSIAIGNGTVNNSTGTADFGFYGINTSSSASIANQVIIHGQPWEPIVLQAGDNGIVISTGGAVQTTGAGSGTVAGNPRGNGAVDLQTYRDTAGQVASGDYAVVSGGADNSAYGRYSFVPGGLYNTAGGLYSFAGGYMSSSTALGSFTWADAVGQELDNTVDNQVMFRAGGGFWVSTGTVYSDPGIYVSPNNMVGIGTIGPSFKLEVDSLAGGAIAGMSKAGSLSDAAIYGFSGAGSSASSIKGVSYGSGYAGRFEGNVYVTNGGTNPPNPAKLQVNGDLGLGDGTVTGNSPVVIWSTAAAALNVGDVVIVFADNQVAPTVTPSDTRVLGVSMNTAAANGLVKVAVGGVANVNCTTGPLAGQRAVTSSTTGQAAGTATPAAGASVGVFLTACSGGTAQILIR